MAFDKIGDNYALSANSIEICLLGYFCMQNSYLWWKAIAFDKIAGNYVLSANSIKNAVQNAMIFVKNAKEILVLVKMISFGNFC